MSAHRRLEDAIADMKQAEACLVFTSGYMANIGVLQAVCSRDDVIIQDKLNHASLVDGAVLSRAELRRYAHKDMKALQRLLAITQTARRRLVVTDSVFSMDGDVAPLGDIVDLARKYDAAVMVDEAHAFGVLGDHGGGLVEHLGLQKEIDIQMGTLSKAAGCFGAYVCGSESLRQYLINKARSFIYTTGMPPSVAAAGMEAVKIIREAGDRRHHLMEMTRRLKRGLKEIGFDTMQTQTPIVPVLIKDTKAALALSAALFEKGFFVQAIRPPTVPKGTARLRLTVTAEHTHGDVELLLEAMRGAA
jgi:8-amino-7-oxononanoate synthase